MALRKAGLDDALLITGASLTPVEHEPGAALWLADPTAKSVPAAAKPIAPSAQQPMNFADSDLVYWDGSAAANANNGKVDGGAGTWSATGSTFTNIDGTVNGPLMQNAGSAVFSGTGGQVTLGSSIGAVEAAGLRVTSSGYSIGTYTGAQTLTLNGSGGAATIDVATGIGVSIYASVSAPNGLVKTGSGSLIMGFAPLGGVPFTIAAGSVTLGDGYHIPNGPVNIVDNGSLTFQGRFGFTLDFSGTISGTGSITNNAAVSMTAAVSIAGILTNTGSLTIGNGGTAGSISGNIVNTNSIGFNRSDTYVHTGDITGGSVNIVKGTVVATGNWTTAASLGSSTTLQIGNGGTSGSIQSVYAGYSSSRVIFDRSDTWSVTGPLQGAGAFEQAGTGTTILLGANTNTNTLISAGTLQVGNGTSSGSIAGSVVDNAALVFNPAGTYTTQAVVSGTGSLAKIGSGTLVLAGSTYSHTGGTTVSGGTLQIGNGTSLSFTGDIADDAALVFSQSAGTLTFIGNISGAGTVTKAGAGTLLIAGSTTIAAPITVSAGVLQIGNGGTAGALSGNIVDNASVVFNRSDDVGYAGAISGTGTVTKAGAGMLTLSGANSYSGGTILSAGALDLAVVGAAGSGAISFTGGAQTLAIDNGALNAGHALANAISGFAADGDRIDFVGIAAAGASVRYDAASGVLTVVDRASGGALANVAIGTGYGSYAFQVASDTGGGTAVSLVASAGNGFAGSSGNDNLSGSAGDDLFNLSQGGNDYAYGGAGDDGFYFGAAFTAADVAEGGAGGRDQVGLQGDYAAGLTLGAGSLVGIESLTLLSGSDTRFGESGAARYSYNLATVDGNVAAGQVLYVTANDLLATESFTFNGSAELDGAFVTYAGLGTDHITGGQQNDGFYFGEGRWNAGDSVDGQGGSLDQLAFQGHFDGANAVVFGAGQLTSIESLALLSGTTTQFGGGGASFSYDITMNDGNVAAGASFSVNANQLGASEQLLFNAAAESNAALTVYSGAGDDVLVLGAMGDSVNGGGGADRITGNGGADQLTGGVGNDTFVYLAVGDSTAAAQDHILDFTGGDLIDVGAIGNFSFIGDSSFSAAGQLRVTGAGVGAYLVEAETTGDGQADLSILVTSDHALTAADFVGAGSAPPVAFHELFMVGPHAEPAWLPSVQPDEIVAAPVLMG